MPIRHLYLVLGDQLDHHAAMFDDFDNHRDAVWMAEVEEEATHVWCHKLRLAYFFSCMRHFRDELRDKSRAVHYHGLHSDARRDSGKSFGEVLRADARRLKPKKLIVTRPGDWRVLQSLREAADDLGLELDVREDAHFLCSPDEFNDWADGSKTLIQESFYRLMRKRLGILVDEQGKPEGGEWNYDKLNRETFGKDGPVDLPHVRRFRPDKVTKEVIALVSERFGDHPGSLDYFDLPVTHREAMTFLRDFMKHRLPLFGKFEDAMWTDETFLYHSRLSAPLNLKLLNPRACVDAAIEAYEKGEAPLNSVEGFVRQLIGWREFVRGVYWRLMPDYIEHNALEHEADLPTFFWDGRTDMECVAQSMRHVIDHGYAHHIHRLMVLGLYAQLAGVHPRKFHDWHMAMYVDAIDWVSLPNTLGMSQWGDGGIVATKPYCASGAYIDRMSNFCKGCRFNPRKATGDDACPFTTLYWDFLARHHERFRNNPRIAFQIKNLERKEAGEMKKIRKRANELKVGN